MTEHDDVPALPHRRPGPPAEARTTTGGGDVTSEATGDTVVDGALADLRALDPDRAPGEQLPVLVAVHEALQQRLSSTEG